jgi:isoamylase
MLLGGDELGRTQRGNNNAYCQDNELSWYDWAGADRELLDFTRRLIRLRREHPAFRRQNWFAGRPIGQRHDDATLPDIAWFAPSGDEMTSDQWGDGFARCLSVFVNGHGMRARDSRGQRVTDDSFLLLFNAHEEAVEVKIPDERWAPGWLTEIDTVEPLGRPPTGQERVMANVAFLLPGRSVRVLRAEAGPGADGGR